MDQHKEIERGMQLAANKPDVMPDEASEQIRPIYEDIQGTLRVPLVNLIFRTLANYPDYLEHMWREFSPAFRTKAFEREADALRGKAFIEQLPNYSGVDLENLGDIDQLRAFNDTIFYVLPKLLLVTTLFYEVDFGKLQEEGEHDQGNDSTIIPLGIAGGTTKVQMVDPEKASDRIRKLFASIKDAHGHPLVSSYYRGMANWPDFLEEAWSRIKPLVGSAAYKERKQELVEQAIAGIKTLPLQRKERPIIDKEQREEIRLILLAFQHKFIPEMLIDVALIKAILDGKKAASSSRFSVSK